MQRSVIAGNGTKDLAGGEGISLAGKAAASVSASALLDNLGSGITVENGSAVTIDQSVVAGTRPLATGDFGFGVLAEAADADKISPSSPAIIGSASPPRKTS